MSAQEAKARKAADSVIAKAARRSIAMSNIAASGNVLDKLEAWAGTKIKPGRNVLKGYPVDIEDQNPEEGGLGIDAVDRDVLNSILKDLRKAGFKTRKSGGLGFVVEMSNVSAAKLSWPNKFKFKNAAQAKKFIEEYGYSATHDGRGNVVVNAENDSQLRQARIVARSIEPSSVAMSNVSAGSPHATEEAASLARAIKPIYDKLKDASARYMDDAQSRVFNDAAKALLTATNKLLNMPE